MARMKKEAAAPAAASPSTEQLTPQILAEMRANLARFHGGDFDGVVHQHRWCQVLDYVVLPEGDTPNEPHG